MAVLRQQNWLSQQRVDLPHLRAIESGIAADFDVLAGRAMAGDRPLVIRGFVLTNISVGAPATGLQLGVADAILFNVNSTEAGTMLWLPSDRAVETLNPTTNEVVDGSWTPGALNYVGIDFTRLADDDTTDLVQFLDPNTLLETPRQVPLAKTLNYRIVISTLPFSAQPNLIPIAKVTLNNTNILTVEDARPMLYRLGAGGDAPDRYNGYAWPDGRSEGTTPIGNGLFIGGDKAILSQKDWGDAVMTRLWEIGGGEYWYSATSDRNVQMTTFGSPFSGLVAPVVGDGEYFSWDPSTSTIGWQGIRFLFDNTTGWFNDVADGDLIIADGEAIYTDLQRGSNATGLVVSVAPLVSLGAGDPPGTRWVMAYRKGSEIFTRGWRYPVGTTFQPATTTSMGMVKLNQTPDTPLAPVVVSIMANGRISITASGGNVNAITGVGNGTGAGGHFTGGAGNAAGVIGLGSLAGNGVEGTAGGQPGSHGVKGIGTGSLGGFGVMGLGGTGSDSAGVYGISGSSFNTLTAGVMGAAQAVTTIFGINAMYAQGGNTSHVTGIGGSGIRALGGDNTAGAGFGGYGGLFAGGTGFSGNGGTGVRGQGGLTNGIGVEGAGTGTASGVEGIGGATSGIGVKGTGGTANGIGVQGNGTGTGSGVEGFGGLSAPGIGVRGVGGTNGGPGGTFTGGAGGGNGITVSATLTGIGGVFTGGATDAAGVDAVNGGTAGFGVIARSAAGGGTPLLCTRNDGSTSGIAARIDGSVSFGSATDVSVTTGITNKLTKALVPKAWGTGTSNAGTPLEDGANVTSMVANAAGYMTVTMASAMANSTYCVVAHCGSDISDNIFTAGASRISSTVFRLYLKAAPNGTALDPTALAYKIHFIVFGQQ